MEGMSFPFNCPKLHTKFSTDKEKGHTHTYKPIGIFSKGRESKGESTKNIKVPKKTQ